MQTYKPCRIRPSRKPELPCRNENGSNGPRSATPPRTKLRKQNAVEKLNLDRIWAASYYGDEEHSDASDVRDEWVTFSRKDGTLVLKKGLNGEVYPITDHYEVFIENTTCKGQLLSELIHNVVEKTGVKEAPQRNGATLIFEQDLLYFIKGKEISPVEQDKNSNPIGKGEFSDVFLGEYQSSNDINETQKVAIKRVKQTSNYALTGGMELAVMAALTENEKCPFLLSLIGWYRDPGNLYVVSEYMPNGTLDQHLKTLSLSTEEKKQEDRSLLGRFVHQVASGMLVMENAKLLHRDLAARNIFLDEHNNIKIGDFGMSRPFYSRYSAGVFAVRWTAPEVLANESTFTNKADVWSFGVLVWEIYSFGRLPYSDIPSTRLKEFLHKGKRLEPPIRTPSKISQLMNNCWELEPKQRCSFKQIVEYLDGKCELPPPSLPQHHQKPHVYLQSKSQIDLPRKHPRVRSHSDVAHAMHFDSSQVTLLPDEATMQKKIPQRAKYTEMSETGSVSKSNEESALETSIVPATSFTDGIPTPGGKPKMK